MHSSGAEPAKELATALNVVDAHGSLRGADIGVFFASVNVCVVISFCGTHWSVSV